MPDKKSGTFGYRQEVLDALLKLLAPFDDVTRDNMFGFPSFRASGQIFACVYEKGISLKMPKAASEAIVQSPGISPFIPFGRARMRQWIHIERKKVPAYAKDFPLIEASIHYVRTLKPREPAKKMDGGATASKKVASEKQTPKPSPKPSAEKTGKSKTVKAASKTSPASPSKKAPAKKAATKKPIGARKAAPKKKAANKTPSTKKKAPKKTPAKSTPRKKASKPSGKSASKRRR
jgi:hypothetical protein